MYYLTFGLLLYDFINIHLINGRHLCCIYVKKWQTKVEPELLIKPKIVSEYDQEIPQSQTADNPLAPRGRAAQPSRDTRKTNQAKQPALFSQSRWLQYKNGHKVTYNNTNLRPKFCCCWSTRNVQLPRQCSSPEVYVWQSFSRKTSLIQNKL